MFTAVIFSALMTGQRSLLNDPGRFPIAVWLQSPSNAVRYKRAGINLYVGLWEGPKETDLKMLLEAGIRVICDQNKVDLDHIADPTIVGWLQQDEPDNAQPVGNGYGPCVLPSKVVDRYKAMKAKDGSRPVLLNLGQGVANDEWIGRGNGSSLDDYKTYVNGGDIVSFDIYPVAGYPKPNSEDYLYLVPKGIDRLKGWIKGKTPTWNCIECTGIGGTKKATPDQVRAEVWMSIIHGSTGLIYFVHQFKPSFKEAALLDDAPMLAMVTKTNEQIQSLAAVINSGKGVKGTVNATSDSPVDTLTIEHGGAIYIFAVGMRNKTAHAIFGTKLKNPGATVEVIGESRTIKAFAGTFEDSFSPYGVHLYRIVN